VNEHPTGPVQHAARHSAEERKLQRETLPLDGPCVVHVVRGELAARAASSEPGESGECVRLREGDLLSLPHGGACRLGSPREEGEVLRFQAEEAWAARALGLAGCEPAAPGVPFFVDRAGSDAARRGGRLLRELLLPRRHERRIRGLRETALCLELLAIAFEDRADVLVPGTRRPGARARERRSRFLEVVRAVEEEPLDGVSLASVADRIGISERQASRLFRSELGTTFREHVTRVRMERAKALLRDTRLPVIEVAAETGWSSLGHFTATFRRRVGLSPSHYRRACREGSGRAA